MPFQKRSAGRGGGGGGGGRLLSSIDSMIQPSKLIKLY